MTSTVKNILIFAGIAIALVLIYLFFIKGGEEAPGLVSTPSSSGGITVADRSDAPAIGNEFLGVLLSIKNIKLDDSIFTTPAFTSLRYTPIDLTPEGNEGRPNPFAPIGVDKVAPAN